jgi:hypothetical protein
MLLILLALSLGVAAAWLVHRPPTSAGARRPPIFVARLRPAIEEVRPFRYRIVRGSFQRLLDENSYAIHHGCRCFFSIRDGGMVGLKLYAVWPGSLSARLGFANGDLLERVNGLALTSPDRVLEAVYTRLPQARRVRVDLTRRGAPLQIVYEIVD